MGLAHLLTPLLLALPLATGVSALRANPPSKRNGASAYANALRKWGTQDAGSASGIGFAKRFAEDLEARSHDNDTFFTVDIEVGNPGQTLPVILDTGSSDTWVYWTMTDYGGLIKSEWPKHYDLSKSSTSFHLADAEWSVQYADGSIASGPVALDTLTLSSLHLPNATLELANASSPGLLTSGASGVLGLARDLPTSTTPFAVPSVKDRLVEAGIAFLTIDLDEGGGSYSLAAEHGQRGVHWVESHGDHWSVDVTDFHTGNTPDTDGFEGVIDSGTTLLLVPSDHAAAYWTDVPRARLDHLQGMWLFPCASKPELPDLAMTVGGYEAVVAGQHLDFGSVEERSGGTGGGGPGEQMCYGGLQSSDGLGVQAILGDVFLKSQVVVLGLEDGKVGFAGKSGGGSE